MKHFVVEATSCAPIEQRPGGLCIGIAPGCRRGTTSASSSVRDRRTRPTGGYLVARAEIGGGPQERCLKRSPSIGERLATFTFTEFQPVKRQPWTEEWFGEPTRGTTKSSIYPAE